MSPDYPADRDLYASREIARYEVGPDVEEPDFGLQVTIIRRLAARGDVEAAYGGKLVRWPKAGVKSSPERLYSVRNHEKYQNLEQVKEHLRGSQKPPPTQWYKNRTKPHFPEHKKPRTPKALTGAAGLVCPACGGQVRAASKV
jgi:hypothetical protein